MPSAAQRPPEQVSSRVSAPDAVQGSHRPGPPVPVVIDCDDCDVRGAGCPDCMMTFLLGGAPDDLSFDAEERRAIDVLAAAGLICELRIVESVDSRALDDSA